MSPFPPAQTQFYSTSTVPSIETSIWSTKTHGALNLICELDFRLCNSFPTHSESSKGHATSGIGESDRSQLPFGVEGELKLN